jgi:hypothetical protein
MSAPGYPAPFPPSPGPAGYGPPPGRRRSGGLIAVLVVLIVLILVGVVVLVALRAAKHGGDSGSQAASSTVTVRTSTTSSRPTGTFGDPAEAKRMADGYAQVSKHEQETNARGTTANDFAPYACPEFLDTIRKDYQQWQTNPPTWTAPTSITVSQPQISGTTATARYVEYYADGTRETGTYQEQMENGHWCVSTDKVDN